MEYNNEDGTYPSQTSMRNAEAFQEEYDFYRRLGELHVVALNRARDYYNAYLRYEVSLSDVLGTRLESNYTDEQTFNNIQFNQVVRRALVFSTPMVALLLWHIIVKEDLDELLDDDLYDLCSAAVGDCRPELMKDIATNMGFKTNSIGVSTKLWALKQELQNSLTQAGIKP